MLVIHSLGQALVSAAKSENVSIPDTWVLQDHQNLDSEGVTATINGNQVHVGNMHLFDLLGVLHHLPNKEVDIVKNWMQNVCTVGLLSVQGIGIVASFCVADAVRQEAKDVVNRIQKLKIEPVMLTGDNSKAALHIGKSVSLMTKNIKSQLLPEEKLKYIEKSVRNANDEMKRSCLNIGKKNNLILMVGDSVNDAPVLTMADVGVAIGAAGAAITMESADVTLLDSDLRKLFELVTLSKQVSRTVKENIVFCLLAKSVVMGFTLIGYRMQVFGQLSVLTL